MRLIKYLHQWWWRRRINDELQRFLGVVASKLWQDRIFQEYYPQQTPRQAVMMEFLD